MKKKLYEIPIGEVFKIGLPDAEGFEFIKFAEENGVTVAVSSNCLYYSRFGHSNDFAKSKVLTELRREVLPRIEAIVGAENVFEFETDLFSLDGSRKHGVVKSKISIPTFDFYRQNRGLFGRYKLKTFWWLATPDSTSEYYNDNFMLCVSPSGIITSSNKYYSDEDGVRPMLRFSSHIEVEEVAQND